VKTLRRELALAAIVAALMLAFSVQLRRGDQVPTPAGMTTFVAAPPPSDVPSGAMSFAARMSTLDTTVQELRLETHRGAFTAKLAQIVTAIGTVQDAAPEEISSDDIERLRELVNETVDAIERRLDAQLDGQDVQQHLAGTIYELRRRMESVEAWLRHLRQVKASTPHP
jgi:hypothetical protein